MYLMLKEMIFEARNTKIFLKVFYAFVRMNVSRYI